MANKNIRGITIEINGDVTKLDKALRQVDSELSTTQKNLKEVDRLLKLDPGNVELLDQKQRLLSQSVEQTSNRYETLKKTLEESTASNVQFERWTEAQKGFEEQTKRTQEALTALQREQQQLQALNFAPDSSQMQEVQSRIDATRGKLQELEQAAALTFEELGKPISIDQYDALQRELADSRIKMEDAQKAAEAFERGLDSLGSEEEDASEQTSKLSELLGKAGISTSALTAAGVIALASAAIKEFSEWTKQAVVDAADFADEINTLSKQTGFSTDFLQELDYASELIDVRTESIVSSMRRLKKNLGSDSADVRAAFEQLNIIPEQLSQSGASMEDVFRLVVEALSHVENELERDQLAMRLFGRSADDLAGVIDDGGAKLREYAEAARQNGYVLSREQLDALVAVDDQFVKLDKTVELAKKRLAVELAPEIVDLTEKMIEFVQSTNWELVGRGIAALLRTATPLIIGLAEALAGLAMAVASLMEAVGGIGNKSRSNGISTRNDGTLRSSVPGFANGAVVEPNNPMLAVIGDNPREREVIAPRSEIVDATMEAISRSGGAGGGQIVGVIRFNGTDQEIVRALSPALELYWSDRGATIS